jgi:hypothetical protein
MACSEGEQSMIVKLSSDDALLLANFLVDVTRISAPKEYRKPVARLLQEVKSQQIDSTRFLHVYPVLQSAQGMFHTQVARVLGWDKIARWKRILFFPAVAEYFFRVRPIVAKYRRQLNQVARMCRTLKARCEGEK